VVGNGNFVNLQERKKCNAFKIKNFKISKKRVLFFCRKAKKKTKKSYDYSFRLWTKI